MKKLVLILAVLMLFCTSAFAQDLTWAGRIAGGVTGVRSAIENGHFKGFVQASLMRKAIGNKIYGKFSFTNIDNAVSDSAGFKGEDYALGTYIFAIDPMTAEKSGIPIAYMTLGVGGAHQTGYFAKISFDAGVGMFWAHPLGQKLGDWCIELDGFKAETDQGDYWSGTLSVGLQIPL